MDKLLEETKDLLTVLSDEDLLLANKLVKKLVKASDPDFTMLTDSEKESVDVADSQLANGQYISEHDVWKQIM